MNRIKIVLAIVIAFVILGIVGRMDYDTEQLEQNAPVQSEYQVR